MTRGKTSMTSGPRTDRASRHRRGWVAFVGSGPGDPGLLTVRAVELLREADVVVTEVPEHAGAGAHRCSARAVDRGEDAAAESSTAASARTASR